MTLDLQNITIEINTPIGIAFRGFGRAISIKARKQVIIEFRRNFINYVSLSEQAELTFKSGKSFRRFFLNNAMARLDRDKLSILAETVASPDMEKNEGGGYRNGN